MRRLEIMEAKKDSLDQLFDNFNKKMIEQFKDILSKIDNINSKLKETLED
jgi:phage-related tail protein